MVSATLSALLSYSHERGARGSELVLWGKLEM